LDHPAPHGIDLGFTDSPPKMAWIQLLVENAEQRLAGLLPNEIV
jgi:hypothetical protein